jgi:antagonist of KipI
VAITIERPGLFTMVQDLGRYGHQHHGLSPGGAMDATALRVANLLVGNQQGAAGLEATLVGPSLVCAERTLVALTGGDFSATVNSERVPRYRPFVLEPGESLSLGGAVCGARGYLAVAGGIDTPLVLGSRATDLRAGIGGLEGRALRAGDAVPIGGATARAQRWMSRLVSSGRRVATWGAVPHVHDAQMVDPVVRALPGLEYEWVSVEGQRAFWQATWTISSQSDRMGLRLGGPRLELTAPRELVSSPVTYGTVQLPAAGAPIVLGADRQTVGGYPRIAQVADVDLPLLAQLAPGGRLRFRQVSLDEALALSLAGQRAIHDLAVGLTVTDG